MGKEKEEDKSYGWNELMGGILRQEVKAIRKMNFVGVNQIKLYFLSCIISLIYLVYSSILHFCDLHYIAYTEGEEHRGHVLYAQYFFCENAQCDLSFNLIYYQVNTVVQLILVAASLAAPVFNYVDSVYLQTLWYVKLQFLLYYQ